MISKDPSPNGLLTPLPPKSSIWININKGFNKSILNEIEQIKSSSAADPPKAIIIPSSKTSIRPF